MKNLFVHGGDETDLDQGHIITVHDYGYDRAKMLLALEELKEDRQISLVIPIAYKDMECEALPRIVSDLNKATYLKDVTVALQVRSSGEFASMSDSFKPSIISQVMWCCSPRVHMAGPTGASTEVNYPGLNEGVSTAPANRRKL